MSSKSRFASKYPKLSGTGKRSRTDQAEKDVRLRRAQARGVQPMSGVNYQAVRTGGWANPSTTAELKFIDVSSNANPAAGAATFSTPVLLNGIASGSTAETRIGRKIVLKSLYLRAFVNLNATSTFGSQIRVIVFYDKQANATAPAITDLLLADNYLSPNNLSNRDRFVVLCDEMMEPISVNANNSTAITVYKKLNLETMFNGGSAGTVGDITSGSVYLMTAQNGIIGTAAPSFVFRSRIRFLDN